MKSEMLDNIEKFSGNLNSLKNYCDKIFSLLVLVQSVQYFQFVIFFFILSFNVKSVKRLAFHSFFFGIKDFFCPSKAILE